MPSVPASFDDLTVGWMADALAAPVSAIAVEPLGPAVGFMGDVARVRVSYDARAGPGERPASVIVKLPPADPGGRRVGTMLNAWAREQAFYLDVAPRSPGARVPHCHHAGGEPEEGRWVLVLEDCPTEPLDPARGATAGQASAAIDALAAFHARWWSDPSTAGGSPPHRPFDWMPGFDRRGVGGLQGPWREAIPTFLERYGHLIPDGTDGWLRSFAERLPDWSDRVADGPLTIVHADYRLDNLRYHRSRVTILDWQTALRGPGPMDLSSFVITACAIDDRRRWENGLLDRYGDGLAAAGVAIDRRWLARSYDENVLWWMGQFANNLARLAPEDPAAQAALDTTIERTYAAAADRDVGRLLT